jgi:hypothetical protein
MSSPSDGHETPRGVRHIASPNQPTMKRSTSPPDLFAGLPELTSAPKFTPKEPTTPAELAQVQADLWAHAPQHLRGIIRGEYCIWLEANWQPINQLEPAVLLSCFSLS